MPIDRRSLVRLLPAPVAASLAAMFPPGAPESIARAQAADTPVAVATPVGGQPITATTAVWTQIAADGGLVARAVCHGDCPAAAVDGAAVAMSVRAGPGGAFTDTVCELPIPPEAASVTVDGVTLRTLPKAVVKIAVVGDTGCRIKGDDAQACNDPYVWPLARIAAKIADWKPELVVHVGDYLYRESPCPPGNAGCFGSPSGDTAETWRADVFEPLALLLPAAPWLFVRGNHEDCDRAGNGWFRHFDPRPMPAACQRFTPPYAVSIGGLRAVVMDTAEAGDVKTTPELNAEYARQLDEVDRLAEPGTWLFTHKQIAGSVLDLGQGEQIATTRTIVEATGNVLPADLDVIVAGHVHLSQAIFPLDRAVAPVGIVAGNGGTKEDVGVPGVYDGRVLGSPETSTAIVDDEFGWMSVELDNGQAVCTSRALGDGTMFTLRLPNTLTAPPA